MVLPHEPAQQQERFTGIEQISHHGHGAKRPPHTAGQSDHATGAITHSTDAMQGALNASAVIPAKRTKPFNATGSSLLTG